MILYQKLKITQSQLNHLYPQVTGSNLRSEIGYTHTHTHTHIYIYILKITLKKNYKIWDKIKFKHKYSSIPKIEIIRILLL